jgi:Domain of unknown function DUF29
MIFTPRLLEVTSMATRIKRPRSALYETDFYAWTKEQAALLRAQRFADLDLEHVIEEIEDLGTSLHWSARSRLRTITEHLLKLQHSPASDPRPGWYDTILVQRDDLLDEMTATLRRVLEVELPTHFERARKRAATSLRKHGEDAAADALPTTCPYTLDQITGDWLP